MRMLRDSSIVCRTSRFALPMINMVRLLRHAVPAPAELPSDRHCARLLRCACCATHAVPAVQHSYTRPCTQASPTALL
jgi:hypothetical protein